MKQVKIVSLIVFVFFVASLTLTLTSAQAKSSRSSTTTKVVKERSIDPRGPENKHFGVGAYLGEPIGFTVKGYISDRIALDGVAAWSFVEDSFTLIGDGTYDIVELSLSNKRDVVTFPFYAGAGFKVAFVGEDKNGDSQTVGAIRIPVGLAAQWHEYPIELFVEFSPGIQFAPETAFDMTGGIGARFYFF